MNAQKEDVGVLKDYTFDLAFGKDENNFECEIDMGNHCCDAGFYLYYEGNEYGGIIDSMELDTERNSVKYIGRTWHGIMDSKVIEPDVGQDYLTLTGEANSVLSALIERLGLNGLFSASTDDSGIEISYQMNRYVSGYEGIRKMLKSSDAKLHMEFKMGMVELSAIPVVDYSKDEQFDTDQISFKITKTGNHLNHVVCLGKGLLKNREVIHIYSDSNGNIVPSQVLTGIDEITATYDYPNAESTDELRLGGIAMILEAWDSDSFEFDFDSDNESFGIGDIIGAMERSTGIVVASDITKKIVKIQENKTIISYKVGE